MPLVAGIFFGWGSAAPGGAGGGVAQFFIQSMDEMSIGARKINETGAALNDMAQKMEQSIGEIGGQIDQFKV